MSTTELEHEVLAEIAEIEARPASHFHIIAASIFTGAAFMVLLGTLLINKVRSESPDIFSKPAPSTMAKSSVAWEASYESALVTARRTGKPIMLNFYTDWCGVCKIMDTKTLPAPEVVTESQNFINVRINAEQRRDVAQLYDVRAYPTFIFLDANGNLRNRFAGGAQPYGFVQLMQSSRT